MDHLDTIMEIKNAIQPKLINKLLFYMSKKSKFNLEIKDGLYKDHRNVKGYSITSDTLNLISPTDVFYWHLVKKEIERLFLLYRAKFPFMVTTKLNQIDYLKYNVGGKYDVHTDQYTNGTRHLSVIMNLNDTYEGGDLIFTDQKLKEIKKFKLDKGSILFFPSNFMYPHSIQSVTKGTRYSIVSWLQ